MFPVPSDETTVHYLPGNNDVGLNMDPIESRHARRRFTEHFGPLEQTVVIRNHTLVLLDASRIIEGSYRRSRATPHPEVLNDVTMSFESSVSPGLLQTPGSLKDDLGGSYFLYRRQGTSGHFVYPYTPFQTRRRWMRPVTRVRDYPTGSRPQLPEHHRQGCFCVPPRSPSPIGDF